MHKRPALDWVSILCFVVAAFFLGLTWASAVAARGLATANAGVMASVAQVGVLVAAGLTMGLLSGDSLRRVGWRLGPARAYLGTFLAVAGMVAVVLGLAAALGFVHFAGTRGLRTGRVLGTMPLLWAFTCLFSLAEEFGWRGFLLPKLLPLGVKRALLWSSLGWCLWQAPLVYYGLLDASLFAVNAPLTLLCHSAQAVGIGVLFGYLRLRYGSVYLPAFAHGTFSALGGVAALLLAADQPLWGGFGGPIGTAAVVALAGWVWWGLDRERSTFFLPGEGRDGCP